MIRLMKLPAAGRSQAVRLDVSAAGAELAWMRQIGASVLRTRQYATGLLLVERSGIGRVVFGLAVDHGSLLYRQRSMSVAGVHLPAFISPRVSASVSPVASGWRVSVAVEWRARLLCRYAGIISPV